MGMEQAKMHASWNSKGSEQADGAGPALVHTKGRTNMYIEQSDTNKQMHHGKKNTQNISKGRPSRPPPTSIARKDAPPTEKRIFSITQRGKETKPRYVRKGSARSLPPFISLGS